MGMDRRDALFSARGIDVIEIAPVVILDRPAYCVGFEGSDEELGPSCHIALCFVPSIAPSPELDLFSHLRARYQDTVVPVRLHSECLLGDAMLSNDCDCGPQLEAALRSFARVGWGVLLYLRQEGRGIGLKDKLRSLALQAGFHRGLSIGQEYGADDANRVLGHPVDGRRYTMAADFLDLLGPSTVLLLTGNPQKIAALEKRSYHLVADRLAVAPKTQRPLTERGFRELGEKLARGYGYG